jgi:hypothetical protein
LLESLPALPSNIEILIFRNNLVKTIPTLPSNLIELNCSSNKLKSLPHLPLTLKNLFCANNSLRQLPKLPPKLKKLGCKNNLIMRFPKLPKSLTHLITNFEFLHDDAFKKILIELQIARRGNNVLDKMTQCKISKELIERTRFQPQWRDFVVPDFFNPTLNGCREMFSQPEFNNDGDDDSDDDLDDDFDDDDENSVEYSNIIENLPDIKLQTKGIFLIKKNAVGENVIDRTPDENVVEFIKNDPDNVVLYFNGKYYLYDRTYFRIVPENLTYICDKEYEHGLDVTGRLKKDEDGGHTIYFSMRKLGLYGIVPAHSIKQIVETKQQFFSMESKTPEERAPSTAGYEVAHNLIDDFTSRAHCQEGQGDVVYSIYSFDYEVTNKRSVSVSKERDASQTRRIGRSASNSRERSSQTRKKRNSRERSPSQSRERSRGGTRKQKQPRKKMV